MKKTHGRTFGGTDSILVEQATDLLRELAGIYITLHDSGNEKSIILLSRAFHAVIDEHIGAGHD